MPSRGRVRLIPAVLARERRTFRRRLAVARRLSRTVHLDVMDGQFVGTRSVGPAALRRLPPGDYELHCLVVDPLPWIEAAQRDGIRRIIVHVESAGVPRALARARALGLARTLALEPATPTSRLAPYVRFVDRVLCLGVEPGAYGRNFRPRVLANLRAVRRRWPRLALGADGGVSRGTIQRLQSAGAQFLVVGSAVQHARDPVSAWRALFASAAGRTVVD